MNVFELLKADHKKVKGLFEKIDSTTERAVKARTKLFGELRDELSVHAQVEEEHLYPELRQELEEEFLVLEALEEHAVAKRLLAEIEVLEPSDERWLAKVTVLKEYVMHHVKEEEGEMFKQARAALGAQRARELAERILVAKERIRSDLTRPRATAERPVTVQRRAAQGASASEERMAARGREREASVEEEPS